MYTHNKRKIVNWSCLLEQNKRANQIFINEIVDEWLGNWRKLRVNLWVHSPTCICYHNLNARTHEITISMNMTYADIVHDIKNRARHATLKIKSEIFFLSNSHRMLCCMDIITITVPLDFLWLFSRFFFCISFNTTIIMETRRNKIPNGIQYNQVQIRKWFQKKKEFTISSILRMFVEKYNNKTFLNLFGQQLLSHMHLSTNHTWSVYSWNWTSFHWERNQHFWLCDLS